MKSKLFLFIVPFMALAGCDKVKDATAITVDTTLSNIIPVTVPASKSDNSTAAVIFTKTQDLSLADNTDLSDYLSKIDQIDLSNVVITISGLNPEQVINSISLDVAGVGNIFTQTNITKLNNSFTPSVSPTILTQMATKLKADKKLTFTVSGTASGGMTFTVSCNMTAKVKVFTI
jgi:hypothetical protein